MALIIHIPAVTTIFFNNLNKLTLRVVHNKRTVVTSNTQDSLFLSHCLLNTWFVVGFTDAEGCFYAGIGKNSRIKTG